MMALHHVEDIGATLGSIEAALAPGGWIGLIDLDKEDGSFHDPDQPGIHHHGFDRAGKDSQFLVQEVSRSRDTLTHQNFVGGAADAGDVDTARPQLLGLLLARDEQSGHAVAGMGLAAARDAGVQLAHGTQAGVRIPVEVCHRFHSKAATHSTASLPLIPREGCHRFR